MFALIITLHFIFVTRGHKGGAVCTAALQKKEVEELHLGCGWGGGSMLTVMLGGDLTVATWV